MKKKNHFLPNISKAISFKWITIIVFISFLLILGIFLHDDFGIQWDSESNQRIGKINTIYIQDRNESFYTFNNRYYGPLFEILLFNITKDLPEQQIYFTRHLVTYLFFLLGVIAFYFLNIRIIKKEWLALLASVMLVVSPRIFGDAFYNSKDISFFVVFIFSVLTLHLYLQKKTLAYIILHSLSSAVLIALRVPGLVMVAFTFGFLLVNCLFQQNLHRILLHSFIYLVLTCLLTYVFWPILWHDPINEIVNAIQTMSRFPWRGGVVLYRGSYINATELPWHYVPVWMLISIPLGYMFFALIGLLDSLKRLFKSRLKSIFIENQDFLLISAWLFVPVVAVMLLNSVLYDGWRQMFFVYPAMIILSGMGIQTLLNKNWGKIPPIISKAIIFVFLLVSVAEPLLFIVRNHPLEMVYFNQLVTTGGMQIRQNFEMEYWGLSYRQGLEYVLDANPGQQIRIAVANVPGRLNAMVLPPSERERLIYVSRPEEADYFLTNYRYHPEDYDYPDEVFNIMIGKEKVFSVFQMKSGQP